MNQSFPMLSADRVLLPGFEIDLAREELRTSDGAHVQLRPRSFAVLRLLAAHIDRLVPKEEIMDKVWDDAVVTEDSLTQCIADIRRALGDERRQIVRTVPRRGYLLLGPTAAPNASDPLPPPDRPSIAVLPFQNMSGDPEQEYFADGMVEDIITALSRFKSLFVIARNSSFAYKGKSPDIRQVGRELGVRYVLEGSVRKAGPRLRISGQLVDASTGAHLWADRFDGALEDVFELQDQVTKRVVAAFAPRLEQAEIDRSKRKPVGNLGAYDCYLRSVAALRGWRMGALEDAEPLLRHAIELEPEFASAYGLLLQCHSYRKAFGMVQNQDEENAEVARLVGIVLRIGQDDAGALSNTSWAIALVLRDLAHARLLVDRAVALNPNLALGWAISGWINVWSGNPAVAVEDLMRAIRHDPLHGDHHLNAMRSGMAHALFFLGKYDEAVSWAERGVRMNPGAHPSLRILAASAAFANKPDLARETATRLRSVDPELRISRLASYLGPYQNPEFIEKYAEGLRLAGIPE